MAEGKSNPLMYLRLQIAYALEFAIWGCWSYALGTFCGNHGIAQGKLYAAFALGALFAPVIGPIADKKFSAQKVFAFMQLVCGAALLYCGKIASDIANGAVPADGKPSYLWIAMMFIAGLMFMPSIPLLNAIVFKHIPNGEKTPFVFVFGTIGWIVVNLVITALGDLGVNVFYYIDGGLAILLALYALTLPDTPPSGAGNSDPFGFKALALFKRFDFALFIICATLVGIFGSNYYFALLGECFPDKGVLNQFSEIIFMLALAFTVKKIGLKWTLTLGMGAWGVRYLCFAEGSDPLALVGILCHGFAYAFLYTAAYMYGDVVAPKEMKASVQALIAFLLLGVAQTLSGFAADWEKKTNEIKPDAAPVVYLIESPAYAQDGSIDAAEAASDAAQEATDAVADAAQQATDAVADAAQQATDAVADAAQEATDAVADAAQEATDAVVDAAQEATDAVADAAQEAADAAAGAAEEAAPAEGTATPEATSAKKTSSILSPEYWKTFWDQKKKAEYDWKKIWGGPAIFCLFFALVFAIFGKEPKNAEEEKKE